MQSITQKKLDIKILKASSPVLPQQIWDIESFCLKILEYNDYSLRKALAGKLSNCLQCTFFIAKSNGYILTTAGCLHSIDNPAVAILGPVCTDPEYRKKGLAGQVCHMLLEHLRDQKIQAVYLGVKDNTPAENMYKKLGFTQHSGIVMRKLFVGNDEFNRRYSPCQETVIQKVDWRYFPEISALFCEPAVIYCFDLCKQIFSPKYVESKTFLPVFPNLMNTVEKNYGFGCVLLTKEYQSVVGTAFIKILPSKMQNHIAILDFFVLDGFLDKARNLVSETMKQYGLTAYRNIFCYCPSCDTRKKQILLSLNAEPHALLPGFIRINDKLEDIVIYKIARKL